MGKCEKIGDERGSFAVGENGDKILAGSKLGFFSAMCD